MRAERSALGSLAEAAIAVVAGLAVALAFGGCSGDEEVTGARLRFDLSASAGFFDAPFPLPTRVLPGGGLRVDDFPNPRGNPIIARVLAALARPGMGFGTNAAIYLPFDGPIDTATLPADAVSSAKVDSAVSLVDIDPDSPTRGERVPLLVRFKAGAETFSPANLLVLLPRPGFVLRPATRYAALVTDAVRDAAGLRLGRAPALDALLSGDVADGEVPAALTSAFAALRAELDRAGIDASSVRAATVFRTADPVGETVALRRWALSRTIAPATELAALRQHEGFCVVTGKVVVPLVQGGDRPFKESGGGIEVGADGKPAVARDETIRFALSIPKRTMPAGGYPLMFYSAGQGGAYTQVIDRSTRADNRAGVKGKGPASVVARDGVATLSIEAPLVGPRHPSGDTTGLEFFNVTNPVALRDNVRQAALDFAVLARVARTLEVPPGLCADASTSDGGPFRFDKSRFYFYGHSTGATVGALVLGLEPDISAGLLSGFGGSWLYNLTIKAAPIDFNQLVRLLLGFKSGDTPDIFDPPINLAQTLWESAEPMNWARRWAREVGDGGAAPRHVLIIEGVVDGYFPPPAVNAAAIAARAEPLLPTVEPTLQADVALFGGVARAAPAGANLETATRTVTSIVVQHKQPVGIDGHYVPFELDAAKRQYRCFFASAGARVVAPSGKQLDAPCQP